MAADTVSQHEELSGWAANDETTHLSISLALTYGRT